MKNNLITRTLGSFSKEILHNSLFSNELDRLNFNIYEMSYSILDHNWHLRENIFVPYNRIYYVCKGSADIFCNGKCTTITPGNAYILPADSTYSFQCNDFLEKFYFHFNIFLYDNLDIFSSAKNCIELKNCFDDIEFLENTWKSDDIFSVLQVKNILYKTVCNGIKSEGISLGSINTYSSVVKETVDYINKNLNSTLRLADISDHLFLSESYISKHFKAETGHSIKSYINDKILSNAAITLRHTSMTVKEVSNMYGFCDQFYFSRIFSAHYGMSPKAYRKLKLI